MARLIDANALIKEANKEGAYGYVDALQIANAPTIDAVEVVRCKDCLHYCECVCDYHAAAVCADWFCWGGEKRTDFVDDNKIGERKNDV